jgi:hypothetical protein
LDLDCPLLNIQLLTLRARNDKIAIWASESALRSFNTPAKFEVGSVNVAMGSLNNAINAESGNREERNGLEVR